MSFTPIKTPEVSEIIQIQSKLVFVLRVPGLGECWEWSGCSDIRGRPLVKLKNQHKYYLRTSRVAFAFFSGEELSTELLVCHKCDNPICCNPRHLFQGTQQDNMSDMVNKGRSLKGDKHPVKKNPDCLSRGYEHVLKTNTAKLTYNDVVYIKIYIRSHMKNRQIADIFQVSEQTICDIGKERRWKFVP
jgi:hypothetical protein